MNQRRRPSPPQPVRVQPVADHTVTRARWDDAKKQAFVALKPSGLVVLATEAALSVTVFGVQERRYGDNRACWPVKLMPTESWDDQVTRHWDKGPMFGVSPVIRLWFASAPVRNRMLQTTAALLDRQAEGAMPLRKGYVDQGPHFAEDLLELQIVMAADALGVTVWDDDQLSLFLDDLVRQALALQAQQRSRRAGLPLRQAARR